MNPRSRLLLLTLALPLAACSTVATSAFDDDAATDGAIDDGAADATDDAAADSSFDDAQPDVAPDTAIDTAPDAPVDAGPTTLANVCSRFVSAICAAPTEACCVRRSIGYDATGCAAAIKAWCGALVDEVKTAKRTFNPTEFDACTQSWGALETTCSVPFPQYVKQYAPCAQVFPGTVPAGGDCTEDNECIAPPGGVAFCSKDTGTCSTAIVVGPNASCGYDTKALRLCDAGYYCPSNQATAKCKQATAIGGSCTGPNDMSCGYGQQCAMQGASYKCKAGLPAGAQCSQGLQCASWSCDGASPPFTQGTCTDPYAQMASNAICRGVP